MGITRQTVVLVLGGMLFGALAVAAQKHEWPLRGDRPSRRVEAVRPPTIRPRAAIGGGSNGIYCPDMAEGAVGVHDIGWIPVGFNVEVTVESMTSSAFDPVAAVLVASVGQEAGNTIKTTTFYDNDSGGEKDALIRFVSPQAGTYVLMVTDFPGTSGGCYRYQVVIS